MCLEGNERKYLYEQNVLDNCSSVVMGNYDSSYVLMLAFTVILQYNRLTGYLRHITQSCQAH